MRIVVFKDRSWYGWCGIAPRKDGVWLRIGRLQLVFRWERVVFAPDSPRRLRRS